MKGLNAAMLALGNAANAGYGVYNAGRKYDLEKQKQDAELGKLQAEADSYGNAADTTQPVQAPTTTPDYAKGVNVPTATPAVLSSNYQPQAKKTGAVEDVSKSYNPSFEAGYKATQGKMIQERFLKSLEREVDAFEDNENKLGAYNKVIKDQEAIMTKFSDDRESEEYLGAAAKREQYMNQANFHRELMSKASQNVIGLAGNNEGLKEALSTVVQPGMSAGQRTATLFDIANRRYKKSAPKANAQLKGTMQGIPTPQQYMQQQQGASQGQTQRPSADASYLLNRYNLNQ